MVRGGAAPRREDRALAPAARRVAAAKGTVDVSGRRILVLAKKSALRVHQEGQDVATHDRVAELLRTHDPTVARMQGAHEQHEATMAEVQNAIAALGCEAKLVVAAALDEFRGVDPNGHDLVVTVGGDGTLLAASHGIADSPVLAINSAPDFSVGFFCGGRLGNVRDTLEHALEGKLPIAPLTRMQVQKNDTLLTKRVLNEVLLCCSSPAATSRYILEHHGVIEEQKSSGIWIGPAAGSTAAQRSAGGRVLPLGSRKLQFVVREPYTPAGESLKCERGLVPPGEALIVRVKMSDGRLFVDGPHEVYSATTGDLLRFSASEEPLRLVGVTRRRGWARPAS
jgi:NAD+ kinase